MRSMAAGRSRAGTRRGQELRADGCVLSSDPDHQHHGQNRQRCEPAESRLSPRHNDESGEQWAERAANQASYLKDPLC